MQNLQERPRTSLTFLRVACLGSQTLFFCSLTPSSALAVGQSATAEAHRAWMDDAAELQDDLRDAILAKDSTKAVEAAEKIGQLMQKTETYWSGKNARDAVKLAQDARATSKETSVASRERKFAEAQQAFDRMNAMCNACHDLHPEKR
jgi:hypothetical protein